MPRTAAHDGQAAEFLRLDPVELSARDLPLAELIERVQAAAEMRLLKEAYGAEVYRIKTFREQLFQRGEWVKVWLSATPHQVVCFAVQTSRNGRPPWENPLDWIA